MQENTNKFKLNLLITLVVVATLIGLAVYGVNAYLVENEADTMMAEKSTTSDVGMPTQTDKTMDEADLVVEPRPANFDNMEDTMAEEDSMMAQSGYVEYSESAYADAQGKTRVLFFHASWCPTCKVANAELLDRLSEIPDDVVIFKVDYDTETQLKDTYGVTYQHTFVVVDDQGKAVTKWNGGNLETILEKVQ